jgi:membrane protein DedA with SNARE-associated domain
MAGMSNMRYRTFLVWNAAGGILWGGGCVLLGYAFASALNVVSQTLTWAPIVIFALVVTVLVGLHVRRRRRERAEAAAFAESDASGGQDDR